MSAGLIEREGAEMKKNVYTALLTLVLALVLALGVLSGVVMAEETSLVEAGEADSAIYYVLEDTEASKPMPLAEPASGTWEGEAWYDENGMPRKSSGTWTLDAEGTLTVEGSGELHYWRGDEAPWYGHRDTVRRLVIGSGITGVGNKGQYEEGPFNEYKSLTGAVLSDTVEFVGRRAFYNCTALTSVTLGAGLTVIGDSAFERTCLESLTLPAGLEKIGEGAFARCDQLDDIAVDVRNTTFVPVEGVVFSEGGHTLVLYPSGRRGAYAVPAGTGKIGDGAFSGARGLTIVVLPVRIQEIGNSAFRGCDGLERIMFQGDMAGLGVIGDYAFCECTALREAAFPKGLETIGGSAFRRCRGLKKAVLPGTLTRLGENAFSECYNLTDLTLGEGISRIENQAFGGCSRIQRLMFPKSLTYIGSDVFTSSEEADIHFAGTKAEWEAVRLGYNALPEGLRVRCESTGPAEPDLDDVKKRGGLYYDWENESTAWELSLTIDNGGKGGTIAVRAALYDARGRFLGVQERSLAVEPGEKRYELGIISFPGVERGVVESAKVFLADSAAMPLYQCLT